MTIETSKSKNLPGLYVHPQTGRQIVLHAHPTFGSADMDAYVRVGFIRVGDAPRDGLQSKFAEDIKPGQDEEPQPVQTAVLEETPATTERSLDEVSRRQLEEEALGLGIEKPSDNKAYPNKKALADAIAEAKKGQE